MRIRKPLLMGEAPARTMRPGDPPFSSQSGQRLRDLLGVDDLASRFDLRNLLESWPGESGKGDAFPAEYAAHRAYDVVLELHERVVLFAGKRVAKAFGKGKLGYFQPQFTQVWNEEGGRVESLACRYVAVVIPHPSGVNRWYNSESNRIQAQAFFRELDRAITSWNTLQGEEA